MTGRGSSCVLRRRFLRQAMSLGLGTALGGLSAFGQASARVALVATDALQGARDRARRDVFSQMVTRGLSYLGLSLKHLFQPEDRVGIKVNLLGGPNICTDPQLAYAIAERLVYDAGVKVNNIIVFDRQDRELDACGYIVNTGTRGLRCMGTDNPDAGYEERLTKEGTINTRLSNILTTMITSLVNVPVLKDHRISGMTAGLKNHFGCIHSPNKYHANCCDPFVADCNLIPAVRNKQRLIVCDCSQVLYEGGPDDSPEHHYPRNAILVGTDPVALDVVAWQMVDAIRKKHGLPTLEDEHRAPKYILTAAGPGYKLGVGDPQRIQLVGGELL